MNELKPCPICGAKAYVMHDVVDGFDFGWSAGCPRFKLDDGIHCVDENTPRQEHLVVMYCISKQAAIDAWNSKLRRVSLK